MTETTATGHNRSSLRYLRPYRGQLALGVAMLLLTNLFYLGIPQMLKRAYDAIGSETDAEILGHCAWLVGFAAATALARIWSRIWIFNAARAAEYDLRSDLFGHVLTFSPAYYRAHPVGDVMSRL